MLAGAGIESARREAEWLVEAATGLGRSQVFATRVAVGDRAARAALDLAQRRCAGEPLQYLTGVAGFRSIELAIGPGALIPRPETEMVVARAVELLPRGATVIDVGTGSGAIALALADERPDAFVVATDLSLDALAWAARNRAALGLPVALMACDVLEAVRATSSVELIVSNPPYIGDGEASILPPEIVDHEPPAALFAGRRGLSIIRRLATAARDVLVPGGWLVMEIAPHQEDSVRELLNQAGYCDVDVGLDLAGRPRVASGRRPE